MQETRYHQLYDYHVDFSSFIKNTDDTQISQFHINKDDSGRVMGVILHSLWQHLGANPLEKNFPDIAQAMDWCGALPTQQNLMEQCLRIIAHTLTQKDLQGFFDHKYYQKAYVEYSLYQKNTMLESGVEIVRLDRLVQHTPDHYTIIDYKIDHQAKHTAAYVAQLRMYCAVLQIIKPEAQITLLSLRGVDAVYIETPEA